MLRHAEPLALDRGRPAVLQLLRRLDDDEPGRGTVDMARCLRQNGWRAIVASAGGRLERELLATGALHVRLPLHRSSWFSIWRQAGRIARLIRQHRIEIVHARAPSPAWSGAFAARRTGASFLTTFHSIYPVKGRRNLRYYGIMVAGDRVIAASDYLAEHIAATYRVEPERIRTVHRWIDPDEFDPERVRGHRVVRLSERWGIGTATNIVMVPGSVTKGGGHRLLLRAMAQMARKDFIVLFVGNLDPHGAYAKELTTLLHRTGLADRVRFGGETQDLPAALMLADAVVLPATEPDPSGLGAVTAQAMGRPVIVTNTGALPESVMPAATGWLVPPDDPGELARAIDLALSMEEPVRQRLAQRAREFVLSEFGRQPMCRRTLEIYGELVRPVAQAQVQTPIGALARAG